MRFELHAFTDVALLLGKLQFRKGNECLSEENKRRLKDALVSVSSGRPILEQGDVHTDYPLSPELDELLRELDCPANEDLHNDFVLSKLSRIKDLLWQSQRSPFAPS